MEIGFYYNQHQELNFLSQSMMEDVWLELNSVFVQSCNISIIYAPVMENKWPVQRNSSFDYSM